MINLLEGENINKLVELEKISLISTLDIQKNLNRQILIFMKTFTANIKLSSDISPDDKTFFYLNESTNYLNQSNSNINMLNGLLDSVNRINISGENFEEELQSYNNSFKESINCIYANTEAIEKFVHKITMTDFSEPSIDSVSNFAEVPSADNSANNFVEVPSTDNSANNFAEVPSTDNSVNSAVETPSYSSIEPNDSSNANNADNICSDTNCLDDSSLNNSCSHINFSDNNFIENTLVISETQKKVILPYDLNTVNNILQENTAKYHSIQDVIDEFYTKPISYYKFSPISRFKEAYKLVTEKEKGSKLKALSLAFELLGNYNLHPAVITSCNSLDELDIYLACLEENSLEDFHFFNVKYEIPLAVSKLRKIAHEQHEQVKIK